MTNKRGSPVNTAALKMNTLLTTPPKDQLVAPPKKKLKSPEEKLQTFNKVFDKLNSVRHMAPPRSNTTPI